MDVNLTPTGPPETVLPEPEAGLIERIEAAGSNLAGLSSIVAEHPESLVAWAALGEAIEGIGSDFETGVRAYAAFRVGYHRGLDSLRKNGWRGSGYVRWRHESNRGFLRSLDGLSRMAALIGEGAEHERCQEFLRMLDPAWPPANRRHT
jgi:hypothetical protein